MSYLSTIIGRVKHKIVIYKGDEKGLLEDSIFRQAVRNLEEYQETWKDWTPEEHKKADKLLTKWSLKVENVEKKLKKVV
jgi:hypothetical protein